MYLTQSDPVSHEDVLMNTKKDLLALFIASQKSQEDLNYQFAIRIPSILESVYMILRKKWVPSEKILDTTSTKKQKAIRRALFLSISIILILILRPPNKYLLLISLFEKACPVLRVLFEWIVNRLGRLLSSIKTKKRLRKNKRNRK
ncbi:hypothetical protein D8803_00555 [Streptococcus oralis]|jgi:hypothetical protein|uniref:Uncharacterized protein n=1 Tax=Streptococcus oralis TaxID=1303 RepID=A0A3R9KUR3_STROR|nr:hypothetical protein [Streptococcus oralis]RSJ66069.1 hypothetical protein D8803_00555 [Streptococcus oralis]